MGQRSEGAEIQMLGALGQDSVLDADCDVCIFTGCRDMTPQSLTVDARVESRVSL